jgi:hypothetical protein
MDKWLLGQCVREDRVGRLARRWVTESAKVKLLDCETWLVELERDADWLAAATDAKKEHAFAVDCLSRGKSAPTFPKLFMSEDYDQRLKETFARHRAQPELSADAYLRRRHFQLQKALEGRTLIYLDTNHWINFRHVMLDSRHAQTEYAEALFMLNDLAKKGCVLCPISFPLFLELMKQTDLITRSATAELMQVFSGGVCFQFPHELEKLELRQRALRGLLGAKAPDLNEWVWTKVGYLAGEMLPYNKAFSDADNNLIRKISIDGMWELPLEYFIELDSDKLEHEAEHLIAIATNGDAERYRDAELAFSEVLVHEKAYRVRRLMDDLKQIIQELWNDYPEYRDVSKLPQADEGFDPLALPSLQVLASINAVLIVSGKKFSGNDILDLQHAALAVPYCDALVCDRRMANTLTNKPLEFSRVYGTKILSSGNELNSYLKTLF